MADPLIHSCIMHQREARRLRCRRRVVSRNAVYNDPQPSTPAQRRFSDATVSQPPPRTHGALPSYGQWLSARQGASTAEADAAHAAHALVTDRPQVPHSADGVAVPYRPVRRSAAARPMSATRADALCPSLVNPLHKQLSASAVITAAASDAYS